MPAERNLHLDREPTPKPSGGDVFTAESPRLRGAKERLRDPNRPRTEFTPFIGIPGVLGAVTTVDEPGVLTLGGARFADASRLLKDFREADSSSIKKAQDAVKNIKLGKGIDRETVEAAAHESKELSFDMTKKWVILEESMQYAFEHHPEIYPQEIRDNKDAWLKAANMYGSKSVIIVEDRDAYENMTGKQRRDMLKQHAKHIEQVNTRNGQVLDEETAEEGAYTAPDMGFSERYADYVFAHTNWVACQSPEFDGTGEPAPSTAIGVYHGLKAMLKVMEKDGNTTSFAIQGAVGAVGSRLLALIKEEYPQAKVFISDVPENKRKTEQLAEKYEHVKVVENPDDIFDKGEIFIPSGPPAQLNERNLEKMRGKVEGVIGPANYIFPSGKDELKDKYFEDGILVAPAPLVNQGGIRLCMEQFITKYTQRPSADLINASLADVGPMTERVLRESLQRNISPERVFDEIMLKRYAKRCEERGIDLAA